MPAIQKPKHKRRPHPKNNPVPTQIEQCFLCGRWGYMQTHECIGGSGRRQLSIKYVLQVPLCYLCHDNITNNRNMADVRMLQQWGQAKFEAKFGHDEWMRIFKKNYLE